MRFSRQLSVLGLAALLFFLAPLAGRAEMISINAAKVNMRSGPGADYPVSWQLGRGYPLVKIKTQGQWIKVQDFEGDSGWVYGSLTAKKPHMVVKEKLVNVRSGPGKGYKVICQAKYGVVFRTLKRQGGLAGWVKVRHGNGPTGWVKRSLLWGW